MEDTTPEIKKLVYETLMKRSEAERYVMCAEMFETAKELAKIGMPSGLSDNERRKYIFRRIYGEELPLD